MTFGTSMKTESVHGSCGNTSSAAPLKCPFNRYFFRLLSVPGGHVGFIVQADAYLEKMDAFLKGHIVKD